jgi:hypothetical protein
LAAVVIHQTITMVAAVVFESQALGAVKQVWTGYFVALIVVDGTLNLRPREPGAHEEHSQPGLHWGLGLRLSQGNYPAEPSNALGFRVLSDISAQSCDGYQPGVKDQIRGDDSFCQWISAAEVDHGA